MIDLNISDGDIVVVEARSTAKEGETVVALINGQATLKMIYFDGDKIRLEPANNAYQPIIASAAEVIVQGVLGGLLRGYS